MPDSTTTIAHIGVAVTDAAAAAAFYRVILAATPRPPERADGSHIVSIPFEGIDIELLEPVESDSPVHKFIQKRGPGIHHICFRVPDLNDALARCKVAGFQLVDQKPRQGVHGRPIVFLHPKSTSGILLELTE